jgi:hypothetical protein
MTEESKEITEIPKGALPGLSLDRGSSLAVSLSRAEIDQQISTAHAWPRSVTRVMDNVLSLATLDEETAKECIYALPRAGKAIKGPSIRLAEIIAGQWGNCRIGARVVHVDKFEKFVEAEGVFHDLETNAATTARFRRRISDKEGRLFNDDMIIVTGNAACAIAKRNAILGGVPKAVWRQAYDSVESVIVGDVKTLAERRDRSIKAFAAFGVKPEEIFTALGVAGESDITLEHMSVLVGMYSAIKNNEASVEEMFPKTRIKDGGAPKSLAERLNTLAGNIPEVTAIHVNQETGEITGEVTAGSGNVFADIGVQNPEKALADAKLARDMRIAKDEEKKEARRKKADPEPPPMDVETAAILLAGKLAARAGNDEFKKWWRRLSAPALERVEPYVEELHAILAEKTAGLDHD